MAFIFGNQSDSFSLSATLAKGNTAKWTCSDTTGYVALITTFKAAGGSAHPYTGGVGSGAITLGGSTQRSRGIVRTLGGSQVYSAGTVKARGKVPSTGGGYSLNAGTVKARGRAPESGGTRVFTAGSTYSNVTLYIYTGGGAQVYGADTVKSRGKSPVSGGALVYSGASEYSEYEAPGTGPTEYAYVGQGVIVFSDGSEHAIGKVYAGGGAFVFSGGSVYVKTAGPRAYSYTGLSTGAIVYTGATVYFKTAYVSTARQVEAKPGTRTAVMEAVPQRPAAEDGAYTEPGQDGIWDEYPVDGAYTRVGYEPEMKPPRRATPNMEGKPN